MPFPAAWPCPLPWSSEAGAPSCPHSPASAPAGSSGTARKRAATQDTPTRMRAQLRTESLMTSTCCSSMFSTRVSRAGHCQRGPDSSRLLVMPCQHPGAAAWPGLQLEHWEASSAASATGLTTGFCLGLACLPLEVRGQLCHEVSLQETHLGREEKPHEAASPSACPWPAAAPALSVSVPGCSMYPCGDGAEPTGPEGVASLCCQPRGSY